MSLTRAAKGSILVVSESPFRVGEIPRRSDLSGSVVSHRFHRIGGSEDGAPAGGHDASPEYPSRGSETRFSILTCWAEKFTWMEKY